MNSHQRIISGPPSAVRVLVFGFGNPGRCDDGLGPAFARLITQRPVFRPGLTLDTHTAYQPQVEDAELVSRYDVVFFVDASVSCNEPFELSLVDACEDHSFTTHAVSPEAVMAMARGYFKADVEAYVLGIRGYEFDRFEESLSNQAQANLMAAVAWFEDSVTVPRPHVRQSNGRVHDEGVASAAHESYDAHTMVARDLALGEARKRHT